MDEHTEVDLSQDLESFRKQWRDEVVHHHQHGNQQPLTVQSQSSPTTGTAPLPRPSTSITASSSGQKSVLKPSVTSPKAKTKTVPPASPESVQPRHHQPLTSTGVLTPPSEASALDVYALAIDAERSGQLGPAVKLYQRAFRMNDQIDKLYQRTQKELALRRESRPTVSSDPPDLPPIAEPTGDGPSDREVQDPVDSLVFDFKTHFQLGPDYVPAEEDMPSSSSASPLYTSIANEHPTFVRAEETEPYDWGVLPEEIIISILTASMEMGDWRTVSTFERVCRKAFLLGREQSVWKRLCALTFVPPQVDHHTSLQMLAKPYHFKYRETFMNQPRVRMDGLYISVVHYHRQGITENSWYDEVHTVTYHRLLRFYADGTVISLLSTEHPSTLVPLLNRSLRMKGLHHGNWSLTSFEASHHKNQVHLPGAPRVVLTGLIDPGLMEGVMRKGSKYEFEMDLGLRCTQLGRWNKLDLSTYFSNNLLTGETIPISMAVQKPFYFSKVKSWPPFG